MCITMDAEAEKREREREDGRRGTEDGGEDVLLLVTGPFLCAMSPTQPRLL